MTQLSLDDALKAVGGASGLKFGKGIVGKTGYIAVAAILVWVAVIWKMGDNLIVNAMLFGAALIPTFLAIWSMHRSYKFAEQNPGLALLEGAEVIAYKQLEITAAGQERGEIKTISDRPQAKLASKKGSHDAN